MHASAEVHLKEIEFQIIKEQVTVLLVMFIKSYEIQILIMGTGIATGIMASIRVDTSLQTQLMDMSHYRFQSIGECLGINFQGSVISTSSEIAVINIDILIACRIQSCADHGTGLIFDDFLINPQPECIPRTPSHRRRPLCFSG